MQTRHQEQWDVIIRLKLPTDRAAPGKASHIALNATMRITVLLLVLAPIAIAAHGRKVLTATP